MQKTIISVGEAKRIIRTWQAEQPTVEVIIDVGQPQRLSHAGQIQLEPEGQVVIAHLLDRNHYLTTTITFFDYQTILLSEKDTAITFKEPYALSEMFRCVTLAWLKPVSQPALAPPSQGAT